MERHNYLLPTRELLGMGSIPVALLSTESEEREVLGVGSIPVAILLSCHNMKSALQLHNMNIVE